MISKKILQEVGKEMNEVMGLEDPGIQVEKGTIKSLKGEIEEAAPLIDPDKDEFSEDTIATLKELNVWPGGSDEDESDEEQQENEDEPEDSLKDEIEDCSKLKGLKDICKANDEFKGIRGELSSFKTFQQLKNTMLETIGEGIEVEEENSERSEQSYKYILNEIENAEKLQELKNLAEINEAFKSIRNNLSSYKNYGSLKGKMKQKLDKFYGKAPGTSMGTPEGKDKDEEPQEAPAKKKAETSKQKKQEPEKTKQKKQENKAPSKSKDEKETRMSATRKILEESRKTPMSISEMISRMVSLYGGSENSAKNEITLYIRLLRELELIEEEDDKIKYIAK